MSWIEELDDEKKKDLMEMIIMTVKEIREQIALDIEHTIPLWKSRGLLKSRRTLNAFKISAAIARGQHEKNI
jgi:hypothetical protein